MSSTFRQVLSSDPALPTGIGTIKTLMQVLARCKAGTPYMGTANFSPVTMFLKEGGEGYSGDNRFLPKPSPISW